MNQMANLSRSIDTRLEPFAALADRIWEVPEIRFTEENAAREHIAMLEELGFAVTRNVADIPTAFIGEAGSGGPVIAILGEFDALAGLSQEAGVAEERPLAKGGNGHGCGHNLLGTASLMAAAAVKDYLADNNLPGTIRYYGCPAEEGGSGKTYMVRAGAFADVDAAICWHPGSFNRVMRSKSLANIQAFFRFKGKASHAAASPHLGRSALDAVELMSIGVQYMREHMPSDARIHHAITNSGGISPNVVQAEAEALWLVRSPDTAELKELFERVRQIGEGAALMTGTTMSVEIDRACSSTLCNDVLEEAMEKNLMALGAPDFSEADLEFAARMQATLSPQDIDFAYKHYSAERGDNAAPLHLGVLPRPQEEEIMHGSTDVGDVSQVVPTVQSWVACHAIGSALHTWQIVAQGKSALAHKGMAHAAKLMAATAIDMIGDADLLAKAKAELNRRRDGRPYICPIPDDVIPPCNR